jgi:xanthine dehydrogenase accessory factor
MQLYRHLAQVLPDSAVVIATVMQTRGSVPREVGAKMLIVAEGEIVGTIGGGAGEAKVIRQAQIVLQTGQKQRVEVDLTGSPQQLRNTQGICGGTMQIWLERWDAESLPLVEQIISGLQAGQTLTLVTPFAVGQTPFLADFAGGVVRVEGAKRCASTGMGGLIMPVGDLSNGRCDFDLANSFVELLRPDPTLLIVGAGHVGEQLAKIASLAGFQIVVQDERPEWANAQRYPDTQVFTAPIANVLQSFTQCTEFYVALVTRSYQQDLEALIALLQRPIPCTYVGMIGSQKRVRQVYEALPPAPGDDLLPQIHAPIGLDIGALTPAEIAVSICAELIQIRRCSRSVAISVER